MPEMVVVLASHAVSVIRAARKHRSDLIVMASHGRKGLKRLPVYGSETAAKVLDESSQPSNDLMSGWKQRPKGDPGALPNRPKPAASGGNGGKGGKANG